jgi:hypothetical protein
MSQLVQLKRSSTPAKVPATTDLALGEIAINTYDGKVYIKKNDGSDSIVEVTGSTGGGGATGGGSDKVFFENDMTVNSSYSLTANKNAGTFGPVTVADGAVVTVPTGAVWTIV